jgi:hypothetical protein
LRAKVAALAGQATGVQAAAGKMDDARVIDFAVDRHA